MIELEVEKQNYVKQWEKIGSLRKHLMQTCNELKKALKEFEESSLYDSTTDVDDKEFIGTAKTEISDIETAFSVGEPKE